MKSVRLLAVLAVLGMASTAHAEFGILGGLNMANISIDPAGSSTYKSASGIGGGLYFAKGLSPLLTLEVDALYLQNKINITGTTPAAFDITQALNTLQIPVIARFNFSPFWNLGAGLYYAMAMGDTIKQTDNTTGVTTDTTFSAQNLKKSDYGLLGSIQIRIPAGPVKVLLDGRYVMGLAEQSESATKIKNKAIQAFAGIGWGW